MSIIPSEMIHIKSSDRYSGDNYHFNIKLNTPKIANSDEVMLLSLISAVIPRSWYNITTKNNKIYYTTTTAQHAVIIPPGNYDINKLTTALKGSPAVSGLDVTYDDIKNIFTFKLTNLTNISFPPDSTLWKNLNMDETTNTAITVGSNTFVVSGYINLNLVQNIRVLIHNLNTQNTYNTTTNTNDMILANIMNNAPSLSYLYYYPSYRNSIAIDNTYFDTLDIALVDSNNEYIEFEPNTDVELVIRVDWRKIR